MEMGCVKMDVSVNGIGSIALCRPKIRSTFAQMNGYLLVP